MSRSRFIYSSIPFAIALSLLTLGCASSESEPRACQPRSTAWIRHALIGEGQTEEEQLVTELLILGHTASSADETDADCLLFAQFDYEGSTLLDKGEFVLDEESPTETAGSTQGSFAEGSSFRGVWTVDYRYDFIRQPELGILKRRGASRTPYPLPENQRTTSLPNLPVSETPSTKREIEFIREGNRLRFTVDGETKWFEELGPLVESLDANVPEQLTHFVRMANVGLLVSQARLVHLFSLTLYRAPGEWEQAGLLSGYLTPGVTIRLGEANSTLDYQHFSDIPGLSLHGAQLVNMSWSGDGHMDGSQFLELSTDEKSNPFASAEIDYGDVAMKDGFADSGTLTVRLDGEEYEVDVEDAFVVDFRGLIPLE